MVDLSPAQLFKTIRRIQIETGRLATDVLAGAYRSAFKGKGMEFEEVRPYQFGDEIRHIDWNVTARMHELYVKNFREERELSVMLVVDVSASARFGSLLPIKSTLIAEIGALLAFSAIKNQDKVGLLLFSEDVEKYLPPQKGVRHVLRVIRELLTFRPQKRKTNIGQALSFLGRVQRRSGMICFLISDFLMDDTYAKEAALTARRCDLIAMRVNDPLEKNFPDVGMVQLSDLENDASFLVDTSSPVTRKHFSQLVEEQRERHARLFKHLGVGLIELGTERPYLPEIKKFFKMRERRR